MVSHALRTLSLITRYKCSTSMNMNRHSCSNSSDVVATVQELFQQFGKSIGADPGLNAMTKDRKHLVQYLPKSQSDLPRRSMRESYIAALIPLASNPKMQDKYTTFLGTVRLGRLLEDMDMFAVVVAQKHINDPKLPPNIPYPHSLVTALADRIDFSDFTPKPNEDIKISGHVSWVGKSSIEVVVWLEQNRFGSWHRITRALFVLVARDPTLTKSAIVNALEPADEREKKILAGGEQRKLSRFNVSQSHVSRIMPDQEEQRIIHELYVRTRAETDLSFRNMGLPGSGVWMQDCTLSNTIFSQPENRNIHNRVFGGFIMRQALELSWALGFKFSKYRPKLKSISDIQFNKSIAVNSLIQMHSFVVFTHMQYIQITVFVETFDPQTGVKDTTNSINFTYEVPEIVKEVYPRTYHEAMLYIDGRRHFFQIMNPNACNDDTLEGCQSKL